MIAADSGAALVTVFAAVMLFSGQLQIWQIYIIATLSATFGAYQGPAYMASISMLVPKEQLGRANGMVQATQAVQFFVGPILRGCSSLRLV